jgi:hypothetical protein
MTVVERVMRNLFLLGAAALGVAACKGDGGTGVKLPPGVIALSVGETRAIPSTDAATIQVTGGSAGAEFVLVPFYGSQTPSASVALDFSGEQLTATSGPPTPDVAPAAGAGPTVDRAAVLSDAVRASFDAGLRRAERALAPRMPAARATWAAGDAVSSHGAAVRPARTALRSSLCQPGWYSTSSTRLPAGSWVRNWGG